jgi:signal transduction histidine kinase
MTVMQGTPLAGMRTTFMDRDGNPIPVEGSAQPRFVDGTLVATHAFFSDISERLRTEELEARNAQLEREQQARFLEKMAALGKLSAGLSHELNNPAAAAQRSAQRLGGSLAKRDGVTRELIDAGVSADGWASLEAMVSQCVIGRGRPGERSPLEASYLEDAIQDWLQDRGIADYWTHSVAFVQGGVTTDALDDLVRRLPEAAIAPAIAWIGETLALSEQAEVIARSTDRISELVGAVKAYSFRDQAIEQDVDIHDGLENTLVILAYRLKSMTIERQFDRDIPPVRTYGSGLNQVWTNILDNAVDATGGEGAITIRTLGEGRMAVVEISDDGPGIPADEISRIFEPFYTTKPQGMGTGLGLDIAWRIVTGEHGGQIAVESAPGRTTFRIAIPICPDAEVDD